MELPSAPAKIKTVSKVEHMHIAGLESQTSGVKGQQAVPKQVCFWQYVMSALWIKKKFP